MIVTAKPFNTMTLAELRAEHARWIEATRRGGWAAGYEPAHAVRDELATWIGRRKREEEQEQENRTGNEPSTFKRQQGSKT